MLLARVESIFIMVNLETWEYHPSLPQVSYFIHFERIDLKLSSQPGTAIQFE